jgi:putative FmdB family regulatory protein
MRIIHQIEARGCSPGLLPWWLVNRLKTVRIFSGHDFSIARRFPMPMYDFQCESCQHEFTLKLSFAEYDKGGFKCPVCRSDKVRQVISHVNVRTSRKS